MDKLQLTGRNLGRVFNFRYVHLHAEHFWCFQVKLPNLKLKTLPKQLLGSLPLVITLPGYGVCLPCLIFASRAHTCAAVLHSNEGISAASFCRQVAALVPDMLCNFYLAKNHKMAKNAATTEAREKISAYLESLEFWKVFDVCFTKFENDQILLNKISCRFLLTTKLFSG
jgi:hypothetical protein